MSPLTTSTHFNPRRAAAAAVSRAWLDWGPPQVITWVAPFRRAGASSNSSFLALFPPNPNPDSASIFRRTSFGARPSNWARLGAWIKGVGSRTKGVRGHSSSLVSMPFNGLPRRSCSGLRHHP